MERYYIVVEGERGPAVAHDTLVKVYTEARRLYEQYSCTRRVFVLQAIGTLEPLPEGERPQKAA